MTDVTFSLGTKRPYRPEQELFDRLNAAVESVDAGIDIFIYSGRQDPERQSGSPRHSTGRTADFYLERDGERLQTGDPVHRTIWARLPLYGLNEIGVGMANGGIHAGYGSDDPSIKTGKRRPPLAWAYPGSGTVAMLNERYPDYVKALQETLGVPVDGVFGGDTRTALAAIDDAKPPQGATAFAADEVGAGDVLNDYGTGIPRPLTLDEVRPSPNPLGEEVRALIAELGFEGDDALKDFQRANNLKANGVIGADTIDAANAPNVVRANGRRQRANLFGREPHVVPAPLSGTGQPTGPGIRPRSFDPNAPIPRPRPDLSGESGRSGALAAPKTIAGGGEPSGRSVADEIEEIRRKMRQERGGYFADEALRARYRELIARQQQNRA
jgi:hypothetical protein